MVSVQKWEFFHLLILGKVGKKKVFGDILERKNAFLDYKNKKQKNKKFPFFQRGQSIVLVNKWDFFHLFIFGKKGKKKVFGDILERKNAFLDYKNKKQKKNKKIGLFPQWLVHGFGPKMGFFPRFYVWQNRQEKKSLSIF